MKSKTLTDVNQKLNCISIVNKKFEGDILSTGDFTSFGFCMNGRNHSTPSYHYSFNTQEKIEELGEGHTTALYWEYDGRSGRRWNIDPKPIPGISDYACFTNNPIMFKDPDGDEVKYEKGIKGLKVRALVAIGRLFNKDIKDAYLYRKNSTDVYTYKLEKWNPSAPILRNATVKTNPEGDGYDVNFSWNPKIDVDMPIYIPQMDVQYNQADVTLNMDGGDGRYYKNPHSRSWRLRRRVANTSITVNGGKNPDIFTITNPNTGTAQAGTDDQGNTGTSFTAGDATGNRTKTTVILANPTAAEVNVNIAASDGTTAGTNYYIKYTKYTTIKRIRWVGSFYIGRPSISFAEFDIRLW